MHTEHDSIAQYIWALKEAQQQDSGAIMPITDTTLVMISTKSMLETQWFPTAENKWEELGRSAQTWGKWKELYRKSDKQARFKCQDAGGQYKFGGAVIWSGAGGYAAPGRRGNPITID